MADEEEEEAEARRSTELQALTRSNAALRCLVSLQSHRAVDTGGVMCEVSPAAEPSWNASGGEPALESTERYERLIETSMKLLQEDLQLERKKLKLLLSRQICADVARLVLFVAGSVAVLTVFQPDYPNALKDYVGYSIWW